MRLVGGLLLAVSVSACQDAVKYDVNDGAASGKSCGADKLQSLVGTRIEDLKLDSSYKAIRVIGPDDLVTLDYSATRLNVGHDGKGNIVSFRCG